MVPVRLALRQPAMHGANLGGDHLRLQRRGAQPPGACLLVGESEEAAATSRGHGRPLPSHILTDGDLETPQS